MTRHVSIASGCNPSRYCVGGKTIEYRSRPTRIIGERFYIADCTLAHDESL